MFEKSAVGSGSERLPLPTDAKNRLDLAREALRVVESKHSMRSAATRSVSSEGSRGVYHVSGSTESLVLALAKVLSGPSLLAQPWGAVVGVTDIGWAGVMQLGIDPSRVVTVPKVETEVARVIALLVDGFEVVAVGRLHLAPAQQRTLAARARKLGTTVLTVEPWSTVSRPFNYRSNRLVPDSIYQESAGVPTVRRLERAG